MLPMIPDTAVRQSARYRPQKGDYEEMDHWRCQDRCAGGVPRLHAADIGTDWRARSGRRLGTSGRRLFICQAKLLSQVMDADAEGQSRRQGDRPRTGRSRPDAVKRALDVLKKRKRR